MENGAKRREKVIYAVEKYVGVSPDDGEWQAHTEQKSWGDEWRGFIYRQKAVDYAEGVAHTLNAGGSDWGVRVVCHETGEVVWSNLS